MKSDLLMLPLWESSSTSWRLSSTCKWCCNIYQSHSHCHTVQPSDLIKSVYFRHPRHADLPCVVHIGLLSSRQLRQSYRGAGLLITWNISPSFCDHLVFRLLRIALKAMLCCEDSVCDVTRERLVMFRYSLIFNVASVTYLSNTSVPSQVLIYLPTCNNKNKWNWISIYLQICKFLKS